MFVHCPVSKLTIKACLLARSSLLWQQGRFACKCLSYLGNRAGFLASTSLTLATGQVCLQAPLLPLQQGRFAWCPLPRLTIGHVCFLSSLRVNHQGMFLDDWLYFLSEKYLAFCTFIGNFWCTLKSTKSKSTPEGEIRAHFPVLCGYSTFCH